MEMNKTKYWLAGMMGLVVGDALGVPVQFLEREEIRNRPQGPVKGMEEGGVYKMPKGIWSDDGSMALATVASIAEKKGLDPEDIMKRFVDWYEDGKYTQFGIAFDQGHTCTQAIKNFEKDNDTKTCGVTGEYANGNGALMRILPACIYLYEQERQGKISENEAVLSIHEISGLTHNHLRSKMCCGLYYFMVKSVIDRCTGIEKNSKSLLDTLQNGINNGLKYYGKSKENIKEMTYVGRLFYLSDLKDTPENLINSSGYVIASIEAAIWCLVTTDSFEECLLKAVNLGKDTDTIAAIAGGLAGLYYGYNEIPTQWIKDVVKSEMVVRLCESINC